MSTDRTALFVLALLCAAVAGIVVMLKPSLIAPVGVAAAVFMAAALVLKL
ncbi:hypothetical protein [Streptomyces sp. BH105]